MKKLIVKEKYEIVPQGDFLELSWTNSLPENPIAHNEGWIEYSESIAVAVNSQPVTVCVHRSHSRDKGSLLRSRLLKNGYDRLFDKTVSVWNFRELLSIRGTEQTKLSGFNYSRLSVFVDEVGQAGEIHVLMVP